MLTKLITIMYNLNRAETRIKREKKFQRTRIKFHNIIGFGIISKITLDPKDNGFAMIGLHH